MASLAKNKTGEHTIQFYDANHRRRTIRLGKRTDKAVDKIRGKVEALVADALSGQPHAPEVAKWIRQIESSEPALYDKLAAVELVAPRTVLARLTIGAFIDRYIEARSDVKWSTAVLFGNVRRNLVDYFGEQRLLDSLTTAEADDWRRWLGQPKDANDPSTGGQGLSKETVRQRCRIAKQFFRDAVRRKLIAESPFAEMKNVSAKGNRDKDYFVSRDEAAKVLQACPSREWRLIFALSRFGGLRCPSEHLLLTWGDVDWGRNRLTVHSPKTEHHDGKESRILPLFPELREHLEAVWEECEFAADGRIADVPIIRRERMAEVNLRTRLQAIIKAAGLVSWPKLFQALRSTRQTELEEEYPTHVVCAWLGNSPRVAARHYLQVTDAHFERAAGGERAARALQSAAVSGPSSRTTSQRPSKTSRNYDVVRRGTSKDGRDRTRNIPESCGKTAVESSSAALALQLALADLLPPEAAESVLGLIEQLRRRE